LELEKFFHDVADENKEIGWEELMQLLNNSKRDSKLQFLGKSITNNLWIF